MVAGITGLGSQVAGRPVTRELRPATCDLRPVTCDLIKSVFGIFDIMPPTLPTRAEALDLVHEYTASESLRKHMLAVEAGMRAYAEKYGEDPGRWGLAGLIHDFDYERYPNAERSPTEEHPSSGVKILREKGWPEDILQAILGHAAYCNVPRETKMAQALFAVDELTGLITATDPASLPRKPFWQKHDSKLQSSSISTISKSA